MKVVAQRRLNYLTRSIETVQQEYFELINEDGEAITEFIDGQKPHDAKIDDSLNDGDFLIQSQFIRPNSMMRQGEITLQKIRVNKKARNKKAVAMDVLKMLNEIEGKGRNQAKDAMAQGQIGFQETKIGGDQSKTDKETTTPSKSDKNIAEFENQGETKLKQTMDRRNTKHLNENSKSPRVIEEFAKLQQERLTKKIEVNKVVKEQKLA